MAGNDTVRSNGGNDYIYGGRGNDTLRCADSASDCPPNADTDSLDLIGGPGADALTGMTHHDGLYGDDGADTIDARDTSASDPTGTGIDFINADAGNDTIFAADGYEDLIECGAGKSDSVTWDQGKDRFFNLEIGDWQDTPSPDCEYHNP
jgi:Ca2+-binding RTX toxin-like protein